MNSCGLDGGMHATHPSISQFTRDLETSFSGVSGYRLIQELEQSGLTTFGESNPLSLATSLQEISPETDAIIAQLIHLAAGRPELTSLLMVAVAKDLTRAISRSGAKWLTQERFGDLYLGAREALANPSESRVAFANQVVSRTRAQSRTDESNRRLAVSWTQSMDVAELEDEPDPRLELLSLALERGIVTPEDFHLVVTTRTQRSTLTTEATKLGISYDAARTRRARAEAKLRAFVMNEINR